MSGLHPSNTFAYTSKDLTEINELVKAARTGDIEGVRDGLKTGLTNARDFMDRTALAEASASGHEEIVDLILFNYGTKIDHPSYRNMTALMAATLNGHLNVMAKLLGKGADPDLQNIIGKTALMLATGEKNFKAVKILLETGADTTLQNNAGQTFWDIARQHFSQSEISEFRKIYKDLETRALRAAIADGEGFFPY